MDYQERKWSPLASTSYLLHFVGGHLRSEIPDQYVSFLVVGKFFGDADESEASHHEKRIDLEL